MKKGFRLTKRCLVYGWAIKSASVKIKEINQCSAFRERARNAMNKRRRHPRTQQKRKINTGRFNYFYTEKSITCMSFRVRVTPFTSMLRARS